MLFPLATSYLRAFPGRKASNIIRHIFPTKQIDVQKILDYASQSNSNIYKIIVFGSATTLYCHNDSDLDLAVIVADENAYKQFNKFLASNIQKEYDLIDYSKITNKILKNEIDLKGVCVYDKLD